MTKKKVFRVTVKDDEGEEVENKLFNTLKKAKEFKKEMVEYTESKNGIKLTRVTIN